MDRRRFEHLFVELSLAADQQLPRYALWLDLHEQGLDPEGLSREDVMAFAGEPMHDFLSRQGVSLGDRALRRLRRTVARFDPSHPTPDEWMSRLTEG